MAVSAPRSRSASTRPEPAEVVTFGAFQFAGHVPVGKIADFYGLPVPQAEKATPVGNFVADRLPTNPSVGDSIGIGLIGLVVHDVSGDRITRVGLQL
jgi:potassium/hydrogen antiporter